MVHKQLLITEVLVLNYTCAVTFSGHSILVTLVTSITSKTMVTWCGVKSSNST